MIPTLPTPGWPRVAIAAIMGLLLFEGGVQAAKAGDCGSLPSTRACCAAPIADRCCCPVPSVPTPDQSEFPLKPAAIGPATLELAVMDCPCRIGAPTDPAERSDRPVRGGSNPTDREAPSNSTLAPPSPLRIAPSFDGSLPSVTTPGLPLYLRFAHLRF